jgi:cob(I)alamin adenosyltransferase
MARTWEKVKPPAAGASSATGGVGPPVVYFAMSITTKTGDEGDTDLWSGERVPKDELSSLLGFARLACRLGEVAQALQEIQRLLVRAGGELASIEPAFTDPIQSWDEEAITRAILDLEARIPLKGFVLPGRTEASARIDLARTASRRLERRVVALSRAASSRGEPAVSDILRRYLNRLSDYLFMLARAEEAAEGKIEYA